MQCLKLFGERVMARDFDQQVAELQIRAAILNRFTALGTPQTQSVGCVCSREGITRPQADLCNRAGGPNNRFRGATEPALAFRSCLQNLATGHSLWRM